jgi:hypothetical protein
MGPFRLNPIVSMATPCFSSSSLIHREALMLPGKPSLDEGTVEPINRSNVSDSLRPLWVQIHTLFIVVISTQSVEERLSPGSRLLIEGQARTAIAHLNKRRFRMEAPWAWVKDQAFRFACTQARQLTHKANTLRQWQRRGRGRHGLMKPLRATGLALGARECVRSFFTTSERLPTRSHKELNYVAAGRVEKFGFSRCHRLADSPRK